MKTSKRVTVIVPDRAICVDGEWLQLDFVAPENVRVIQWNEGGDKHIEHNDGSPNTPIGDADYAAMVAPFVALHAAEAERLEAIRNAPPTEEELLTQHIAVIDAELAAIDAASIRPLRAEKAGTATEDDVARLVELDSRAAELRAQRAALLAKE